MTYDTEVFLLRNTTLRTQDTGGTRTLKYFNNTCIGEQRKRAI